MQPISIQQILDAPEKYQDQLKDVRSACKRYIKNFSIKDQEKVETITNIYNSICNENNLAAVNKVFGNLYLSLNSVVEEKYQIKCLQKAKQLFEKANSNGSDTEITDQLHLISVQLHKMNSGHPQQLKPESRTTSLQQVSGLIRKQASQKQMELNQETESIIIEEFDRNLPSLELQMKDFAEIINENPNQNGSEEIIAIQEGISCLKKALLCNFQELAKKILNKESALKILQLPKDIKAILEYIQFKIDNLNISQDKTELLQLITDVKRKLNNLIDKEKTIPASIDNLPEGEDDHLLKILENCKKILSPLRDLIQDKMNKKRTHESHRSTLLYAYSHFFQFTEQNYFSLMKRKKGIFEKILAAEKFFELFLKTPLEMTLVLSTYTSLLVQKQPFISEEKEREINLQKIRKNCSKYNMQHKKNMENHKTLSMILKSNNHKKHKKMPSIKFLSTQSQKDPNKEKVEKIIDKMIKRHEDKKEKIATLLNEKLTHLKKRGENQTTSLLKNINTLFQKISNINLEKHNLTSKDLLKISYLVERGFFFNSFESYQNQGKVIQTQNLFLFKKSDYLNRSLLVDKEKRSFTVFSRLHGDIKKEIITNNQIEWTYLTGGIKRISASALFFWEQKRLIFQETILAEPKKERVFDKKLIDYLFKFRDKPGLMSCRYYMEYNKFNDDDPTITTKQLLIQDRAAGDLVDFIKKSDFKKNSTWKALFLILINVAEGLDYMHSCGDIHWDLKLGNILFDQLNQGSSPAYKGMINDYDTTFNARPDQLSGKEYGEQPAWLYPIYGSPEYQAPEVDEKTLESKKITEDEAKKRDIFALGCTLIDLLNAIQEPEKQTLPIYIEVAKISEEKFEQELKSIAQSATTYPAFLKLMAYHLIHPNPIKRWTSCQFEKEIKKFFQTLNPFFYRVYLEKIPDKLNYPK